MSAHYSPGVQAQIKRGEALLAAEAERRAVMRAQRFDTIAVHGLYDMQAALMQHGSINEPAYFSPAQHFENSDHMEAALAYLMPSWTYARIANPTLHYLEETLALLEGYGVAGEVSASVMGSGMAAVFLATDAFLNQTQNQGPINIVASAKCYGGTFMLFSRYAAERGIEVRWVTDQLDLNAWSSRIDAGTRFVFGEMPSNPGLGVFDIAALAEIAHARGLPLIVDSTVATPALLRPLAHGADIVVHSLSKAMTSSGFAIGGAVIARHNIPSRVGGDELRANFAMAIKGLSLRDHGPTLSPFAALMTLNDLRTLRGRVERMSLNTLQVARFLSKHTQVEAVAYPGLEGDPGHVVARRYLWLVDGDDAGQPVNRYGHLLSFTVKGGVPAARAVFDGLQLIWRATDLGKSKSVATIPAISTHQQQGDAGRALAAVPDHAIRLSVGAEHPDDVMADLDRALARASGTA